MKVIFKSFLVIAILLINITGLLAQNPDAIATSKQNDPKLQWWKNAKFGMFIHFGLYAVPAGKWGDNTTHGEWIMKRAGISRNDYAALASQFNPTKFNAEEWVKLAKDAGQKYMVITAKHHDGFAMFKTNVDGYNIVDATPFKRDVLKELAEACRKYDMKLGFYYSQAQDWYHPGGAISGNVEWDESHKGDMNKYIDSVAIPQVKEILSNYGDVAVLWWDTPTNMTKEMTQKFADLLKQYPNIITNNRLGAGMGGDLETPEQYIPSTGFPGRNWEVCMTMNGNWGYNAWDDRWSSTTELLRNLIDIVSKGGNLLLNVGPNAYGVIPEVCQQNLREIGDWMKINGDGIYGTRSSPFPFLSWGRATRKGQTLYLHVFDWPKDGKLVVPFTNKISKANLMVDNKITLKITRRKENSVIQLPSYAPNKIASVIAIQFEGEPIVSTVPTSSKKVIASSSEDSVMTINLTDGEPKTVWKAAKGERTATLEVDLGIPTAIQCLSLIEPWQIWSNIKQSYELQFFDGKDWKKIVENETAGTGCTQRFSPVIAQKFRLVLKNEKEAPAVNEFILYRAE